MECKLAALSQSLRAWASWASLWAVSCTELPWYKIHDGTDACTHLKAPVSRTVISHFTPFWIGLFKIAPLKYRIDPDRLFFGPGSSVFRQLRLPKSLKLGPFDVPLDPSDWEARGLATAANVSLPCPRVQRCFPCTREKWILNGEWTQCECLNHISPSAFRSCTFKVE